jgi:hypothetical protein
VKKLTGKQEEKVRIQIYSTEGNGKISPLPNFQLIPASTANTSEMD